jgi:aryl-alcohol dehydrogenase-like predicted oxidoreductase
MRCVTTSPLALGTRLFGTRVPDADAFALLDRFVERGGKWIDTADCYAFWLSRSGRGEDSERVIGQWLAARPGVRDRVKLSTKIGGEPVGADSWRGWPGNREGLGAAAVQAAIDGSLGRLGVDTIDLLWLHQEDRSVPIEETVDAIAGPVAAARQRPPLRPAAPRCPGDPRRRRALRCRDRAPSKSLLGHSTRARDPRN